MLAGLNRSQIKHRNTRIHIWLLLIWLATGAVLRFCCLESKPLWSDEWATIIFSLGQSFRTIPLDKIISLETLLQPLRIDSFTQTQDAIAHLMNESTHPPLYFVLSHWWLKLFSSNGDLVSIWLARSLSAFFGILAIPAMFGLGWLLFDSLLGGQIAAALMAVSPYGIYLAQETRHYTLAILWVIASLACLLVTVSHLQQKRVPPRSLMVVWILVNSLGIATHYFFGLTLVAQTLVLLSFWWQDVKANWGKKTWLLMLFPLPWRRISIALLGTLASCSVWVFRWQYFPDRRLTEWIHHGDPWGREFLEPVGRLLAWITTMVFLPPIEETSLWITVGAVALLLPIVFWLIKASWQYLPTSTSLVKQVFGRLILGTIILVLSFPYILDRDITLAARFQFFYFPALLILVAGVLTQEWRMQKGKILVIAVLLASCLGGVTVITNHGYQKSDRPDLVIPVMIEAQQLAESNKPTVIATVHKTHEQTGEMMGLAWEWQKIQSKILRDSSSVFRPSSLVSSSIITDNLFTSSQIDNKLPNTPQFLLLHKEKDATVATQNLYRNLDLLSRPVDLWLVNFSASEDLESHGCIANEDFKRKAPGYRYRLFHCWE